MIKLLEIIEEKNGITIEDVNALVSSKWCSRDSISLLKTVEAFYYSDKEEEKGWANDYINLLNKVMAYVLELVSKLGVFRVDVKSIKKYLLDQSEFKFKMDDFFPFPIYISAKPNADGDWAEIGMMIDQNGKVLEIHEGNDEASPETIALANKLVNPQGKQTRIYGAHDVRLVHKIEETGYLPTNLFVSPYLPHAKSYLLDLKGERSLFSGIINVNDVNQESDLDWRIMGPTKIEKFRYL